MACVGAWLGAVEGEGVRKEEAWQGCPERPPPRGTLIPWENLWAWPSKGGRRPGRQRNGGEEEEERKNTRVPGAVCTHLRMGEGEGGVK